jgi:hypothetical protein
LFRMTTEISTVKEKRELVDRVANSPTFQKSPRLREFLVYVADCTIGERLEDVREQQIAANVFNRKQDYNSGQDNIVRVEARSLASVWKRILRPKARMNRSSFPCPRAAIRCVLSPAR